MRLAGWFGALVIVVSPFSAGGAVWGQSGTRGDGGAAAAAYLQLQQQVAIRQQQQIAQQREQLRREQAAAEAAARAADAAAQRRGIAVVELFTSQGCSSCPPADAALRQVAEVAKKRGLNVYPLSFHVDYWDRLGWKDPYSQRDFSTRQATYASKEEGNQLYTPQMIVNGSRGFIGSDKEKAHDAIIGALRKRPRSSLDIELEFSAEREVEVRYYIDGRVEGIALNVAIVNTPPGNDVDSGENSGRLLKHVNVVRAFQVLVPEGREGSVRLQLPEDFLVDQPFEVIAYVQDKETFEIVGAKQITSEGKTNGAVESLFDSGP